MAAAAAVAPAPPFLIDLPDDIMRHITASNAAVDDEDTHIKEEVKVDFWEQTAAENKAQLQRLEDQGRLPRCVVELRLAYRRDLTKEMAFAITQKVLGQYHPLNIAREVGLSLPPYSRAIWEMYTDIQKYVEPQVP